MVHPKNKKNIDYLEFQKGYVLIKRGLIEAVIDGYRAGKLRKTELRVFAAVHELKGLCKKSKVDLYRIVNQGSQRKGIRRLSQSEINTALCVIESIVSVTDAGQKKPVARKFLRHIAKGACSGAGSIFLLYYCASRIRQPKRYTRLAERERYARFTYRELSELSGLRRASLCDAFAVLVRRGFLNSAPVAKQNENRYGMLFIDGQLVSLVRNRVENKPYRAIGTNKTVTDTGNFRNAPSTKTVTPINNDPKSRDKKTGSSSERSGCIAAMRRLAESGDDWIRGVAQRSLNDLEAGTEQAA